MRASRPASRRLPTSRLRSTLPAAVAAPGAGWSVFVEHGDIAQRVMPQATPCRVGDPVLFAAGGQQQRVVAPSSSSAMSAARGFQHVQFLSVVGLDAGWSMPGLLPRVEMLEVHRRVFEHHFA